MNAIACPRCNRPLINDTSLADQPVACPYCGTAFLMPSLDANLSPSKFEPVRFRLDEKMDYHVIIKQAMIVGTGIWFVGSVVIGIAAFAIVTTPRQMANGMWLDTSTGKVYSDSSLFAAKLADAIWCGACFPMFPYLMAMAALGVLYFATRRDD